MANFHYQRWQSTLLEQLVSPEVKNLHGLAEQGLKLYRDNIRHNAQTALAVTYPTVKQLIGDDLFNSLATQAFERFPPANGDWGNWHGHFHQVIEQCNALEEYPFIADSARLDWLVHTSSRACDNIINQQSLMLFANHDIDEIAIALAKSVQVLQSPYPVADIWQVHQATKEDFVDSTYLELIDTDKASYCILVYRQEYQVTAEEISPASYQFILALQKQLSISQALNAANALNAVKKASSFDFTDWLSTAIEKQLINHLHLC